MKKAMLISLISSALLASHASAGDTEKMTYEKAMESHRAANQQYYDQSVTPEESQLAWDSYAQKPEKDPGASNAQLQEVWKGSAVSVPVTWGQGTYYIEMTYNKKNDAGSVWLTVDNTLLRKNVAVPSAYNYEANFHVIYENGMFKAEGKGQGSATPTLTRISKFPTPQLDECSPGKVEGNTLYCGNGKTCETGLSQRQCASNGGWAPWQTVSEPVCVAQSQQCP